MFNFTCRLYCFNRFRINPKLPINAHILQSLNWQNYNSPKGDANNAETPVAFQTIPSQTITFPLYNQGYHPVAPGHSITARNLSSQFREELR